MREFKILQRNAARDFRDESWPGTPKFHRSVDVRYRGQGYELNIPLTATLLKDFEREHQRRYGYTHPNREVELVISACVRLSRTKLTMSGRPPSAVIVG